ncbi:unnamed protein product [Gadus morhua 'NCC']
MECLGSAWNGNKPFLRLLSPCFHQPGFVIQQPGSTGTTVGFGRSSKACESTVTPLRFQNPPRGVPNVKSSSAVRGKMSSPSSPSFIHKLKAIHAVVMRMLLIQHNLSRGLSRKKPSEHSASRIPENSAFRIRALSQLMGSAEECVRSQPPAPVRTHLQHDDVAVTPGAHE